MMIAVVSIFLAIYPPSASAELSVKEYQTRLAANDTDKALQIYILGLGEGIGWANRGIGTHYCQPAQLVLKVENYIDIIDKQIKLVNLSKKELDEMPIGALLIAGLKRTFPCAAK